MISDKVSASAQIGNRHHADHSGSTRYPYWTHRCHRRGLQLMWAYLMMLCCWAALMLLGGIQYLRRFETQQRRKKLRQELACTHSLTPTPTPTPHSSLSLPTPTPTFLPYHRQMDGR